MVGHVEWVEFAPVERMPVTGEIVHALDLWAEPAGGGAVAAVELARLAGRATLFTALGDDELGHRALAELQGLGVDVHAVFRRAPQRRAFTHVDAAGERTITVIGERSVPCAADDLPWRSLSGFDAVYLTGGDAGAVRAARAARVLTATPRALESLRSAGVVLDALVGSATDVGERYEAGDLDPEPGLVVRTNGASGGTFTRASGEAGAFTAATLPGPRVDAYGCGDCFAAGLTFGLAAGEPLEEALGRASRSGAAALCRRGAHGGAPAAR